MCYSNYFYPNSTEHDSDENESQVPMSSMNVSLDNSDDNRDESVELSDNEHMECSVDVSDDSGGENFNDSVEEDCNETSGEQSNGSSDDDSTGGEDEQNDSEDDEIEIEGKRIVDFSPLFDKIRRVSRHNNGNCPFDELNIVKEIRIGFHSKFIFRCGNCCRKFRVFANDDERTTDTVDINSSAVLGGNLTGIGYSVFV